LKYRKIPRRTNTKNTVKVIDLKFDNKLIPSHTKANNTIGWTNLLAEISVSVAVEAKRKNKKCNIVQ